MLVQPYTICKLYFLIAPSSEAFVSTAKLRNGTRLFRTNFTYIMSSFSTNLALSLGCYQVMCTLPFQIKEINKNEGQNLRKDEDLPVGDGFESHVAGPMMCPSPPPGLSQPGALPLTAQFVTSSNRSQQ
eukprot:565433-Amphidinium_carterae.1